MAEDDPRCPADHERGDDEPADERPQRATRAGRAAIESAAARASVPTATAASSSSVAGQPAPAIDDRRSCERLARGDEQGDGRDEAEDRHRQHAVHLRTPGRVEGQHDVVVVADPSAEGVEQRSQDALVAIGQELPRLRSRTRPTQRPPMRRGEGQLGPRVPCANAGTSASAATSRSSPEQPRILEATPGHDDRNGRKRRGGERPGRRASHSHAPPRAGLRALSRDRPRVARPRPGSRAADSCENRRNRPGRPACVARRVDPHDGDRAAARQRRAAASRPRGSASRSRRRARRHVRRRPSAAARGTAARSQPALARTAARALRTEPNSPSRDDAGVTRSACAGRDEPGPASSSDVSSEDRPRCPHRGVEARLRRRPRIARGIAVEDDHERLARRVLELLHHEPAAAGGRRPVHAPQRLALLVLPHRVEVEAGRPPQEQPPAVSAGSLPASSNSVSSSTSRGCTTRCTAVPSGRRATSSPSGSRSSISRVVTLEPASRKRSERKLAASDGRRGSGAGTRTSRRHRACRTTTSRPGARRDALRASIRSVTSSPSVAGSGRSSSRMSDGPARERRPTGARPRPPAAAPGRPLRADATPKTIAACEHDRHRGPVLRRAASHRNRCLVERLGEPRPPSRRRAVRASGARISRCARTATATL